MLARDSASVHVNPTISEPRSLADSAPIVPLLSGTKLNAEIKEIVKREDELRAEIEKIIAEIEVE